VWNPGLSGGYLFVENKFNKKDKKSKKTKNFPFGIEFGAFGQEIRLKKWKNDLTI